MITRVEADPSCTLLRALVKRLLSLQEGGSFRHHGIGVLQAYVREQVRVGAAGALPEVRIHLWHPLLVKAGIRDHGDVHDHRFDLVSHVLHGTLVQEEWLLALDPQGGWTTIECTHARAAAETLFHGSMRATEQRYRAAVEERRPIYAGQRYTFPTRVFHRTLVDELVVSVVEKHGQTEEPARVLHRWGEPPVPAFGHEPDLGLVKRVIEEAVEVL